MVGAQHSSHIATVSPVLLSKNLRLTQAPVSSVRLSKNLRSTKATVAAVLLSIFRIWKIRGKWLTLQSVRLLSSTDRIEVS